MSDLAVCCSFKSAIIVILSSEVGFLGVQPMHQQKLFNDFVGFDANLRKRISEKLFEDEYCSVFYSIDNRFFNKSYDVDFKKDLIFYQKAIYRGNAMLSLMPSIDDMAVTMYVNALYEEIGNILNSDDEYFEILQDLWGSIDKKSKSYQVIIEHKIKSLKQSFLLSDDRIKKLI